MHIQVNANTLVFFRTSKSAASVTSSQGKKPDLSAFAAMDEDEVREDDDSNALFDDDEEDEVDEEECDVLDDEDEEQELSDEEEKCQRKAANAKKAVEGYASKEKKQSSGGGKRGGRGAKKASGKASAKPKGKSAPKKRALESSKSRSSSITPNPFYASTADSQAGTLVRGSPDRSKAKTAQGGPLRDPEAEKMRITREINARMLKVHHVNGKALGNGEEPEHFVIDIPNRFIR